MAVALRFKQGPMYGLSAEKSGRCREVAVVVRFKQGPMYGLSAKKSGRCREVAVSGDCFSPASQVSPFLIVYKAEMIF